MRNKIKIIDLLCLISNGEEVPKKIIYRNVPMIYDNGTEDYIPHQTDKFHGNDLFHYLFEEETKIFLNDEVEILDKEVKPLTKKDMEALGYACGEIKKCFENGWNKSLKNEPFEEEDKGIPLIPDGELYELDNDNRGCNERLAVDFNFKVLKEKINQVVEELNKRQ